MCAAVSEEKIHTLCSEIKHPEYPVTMYHPGCRYAGGVGEVWKHKMMDWCSDSSMTHAHRCSSAAIIDPVVPLSIIESHGMDQYVFIKCSKFVLKCQETVAKFPH